MSSSSSAFSSLSAKSRAFILALDDRKKLRRQIARLSKVEPLVHDRAGVGDDLLEQPMGRGVVVMHTCGFLPVRSPNCSWSQASWA